MRLPLRALAWLLASLLTAALPAGAQLPLQKALTPGSEAQTQASAAAEGNPDPAAIEARRNEVAAERAALEAQATVAGRTPADDQRIAGLERLERTYTRQIDALHHGASQAEQLAEIQRQIDAGPQAALGAEPPYGIDRLDQLLDAQDGARFQQANLEKAVTDAQTSVEEARRALEERESERRAAEEAATTAQGDATGEAQRQLALAKLASDVARERVTAEQLALDNAKTEREIQQKTAAALGEQIQFVEQHLVLDEKQRQDRLDAIERQKVVLGDRKAAAEQAVKAADRRLTAVQKRAEAEPQPGPALAAELEARRFGLREAQRSAARIDAELERLVELRRLWNARFRLLSGAMSRDDLHKWTRELPTLDAQRERDRRELEARIADLEAQRAKLQTRLPSPPPAGAAAPSAPGAPPPPAGGTPSDEQRWIAEQLGQVEHALAEERERVGGLDENERVAQRLARALGLREARATLADRAADVGDALAAVWSTQLFHPTEIVQGKAIEIPITVGKITTALLIFGLGAVLSRLVARMLAALVRRRSAADEGAINAIQSLVFYALLAIFFVIALNSVRIPVTALTVAGGAIAIGIGFGTQAIVNNFVSGLILMIERPIKVGDVVVYGDDSGRVERIGARSTRIRTFDNVHLIVPNSKVIDNNIVNWTLADDVVRTRVTIGVTYGTPTREVEKLLLELMGAQPDILKHPRPVVLFEEFAPDALRFTADFCIKLSPLLDDRVVRSNLRHAIDDEFRRRGLVIAYPPRDQASHVRSHHPPEGHA